MKLETKRVFLLCLLSSFLQMETKWAFLVVLRAEGRKNKWFLRMVSFMTLMKEWLDEPEEEEAPWAPSAAEKKPIQRMRDNLGHPTARKLARMTRQAGCKPAAGK